MFNTYKCLLTLHYLQGKSEGRKGRDEAEKTKEICLMHFSLPTLTDWFIQMQQTYIHIG